MLISLNLFHLVKGCVFVANRTICVFACCEVDKSTDVIADENKTHRSILSNIYPEEIRMNFSEDYAHQQCLSFLSSNSTQRLPISELIGKMECGTLSNGSKTTLAHQITSMEHLNAIYLQIWIAILYIPSI